MPLLPLIKYWTLLAILSLAASLGTAKAHDEQWNLDDLGNWLIGASTDGGATSGLRERDFDGSAITFNQRRGHRPDDRNQIGTYMSQRYTGDTPDPTAVEVKYAYDLAGRMRYDGRMIYDHDAFGRLVQARQLLPGVSLSVDDHGVLGQFSVSDIGALIAHYTYDGLGRVIRTQRPANSSSTAPIDNGKLCITDLYYDGVRVVQEAGWGGNAGSGGGAGEGGVAARVNRDKTGALNTSMPGLPRRANEMTGSDVSGGECAPTESDWDWGDRRLEREYVWAGDSGAYVDECVAQLVYTDAHVPAAGSTSGQAAYKGDDVTATTLYTLTDHNANVVGLSDAIGRLVGQLSYTPYGEVRAAEFFNTDSGSLASAEAMTAARGNRLGHQGLRTERFDRPWDGPLDVATAVAGGGGSASTGAYRALCHNRNRMYDPAEGRFLEQDPNGLGAPTLSALSFGGMEVGASTLATDVKVHFADGLNAHTAYRSSPMRGRDPLGLSLFGVNAQWFNDDIGGGGDHDPFSMVNEFIIDDFAQKAAYLREYQRPRNYLYVAEAVAFFIPGSWIEAGAERLVATRGAQYFLARAMSAISRINAQSVWGLASKVGRFVMGPTFEFFERIVGRCLHCMSGDTPVWTPSGPVPLNTVRPGDLVETAGDQAIDPVTGLRGTYGPDEAVQLCIDMAGKRFRQVHSRIHYDNGSTTDIYELLDEQEIESLGYAAVSGVDADVWLPSVQAPGAPNGGRGAWMRVIDIGKQATLGDGIALPTPTAAPVMVVFETTRATVLGIHLEGQSEPLLVTATHPLWSASKSQWVDAGQFRVGDQVGVSGGDRRVECIEVAQRGETVYNLTLAGGHTFFVGPERVWVHNIGCADVWHHWIPQAPDIAAWASRSGIPNLERYAEYIPELLHRAIHGNHLRPEDYLPRWRRLMAQYPGGAPVSVIENFVEHLRSYYGVGTGLP